MSELLENEKVKKVKIAGNNYEIHHLPAFGNIELGLKLVDVLGVSFPELTKILASEDYSFLGSGIYKMLSSLHTKDPSNSLILDSLSTVTRNNVGITQSNFNKFYTGNMFEMFEILIEALRFHFKHFLPKDGISGLLSLVTDKITGNSENLTTS